MCAGNLMDASTPLETHSARNLSTQFSPLDDVFDEVDGPAVPQSFKPKPVLQHNRTELFSATVTVAKAVPIPVGVKSSFTDQKLRRKIHEKLMPSYGESSDKSLTYSKDCQEYESRLTYRVRTPLSTSASTRPSYMPQANRQQRRASLTEIGFGKLQTYTKLETIGEGTFSTVYKGQSSITHKFVAMKEIQLEHREGAPCTAIREISLLKDLKHANIVTLHDVIHTDISLTLVFEYVEQNLTEYMDECRGMMSMTNVKLFLFQLLRGLAYCHARKILHRDVKPPNILISEAGDLKLADFGLARAKSVPTKNYANEIGTLWYRPPELLLGSTTYSINTDMWDVGCIFFEMACGRPMFPGSNVEDELMLIWKLLGTPTEKTWPGISKNPEFVRGHYPIFEAEPLSLHAPRLDSDALDLLEKLLQFQSKNRIPALEGMRHQYFHSLGLRVHQLPNTVSIFTLPECKHVPNLGQRAAWISGITPETPSSVLPTVRQTVSAGTYNIMHIRG